MNVVLRGLIAYFVLLLFIRITGKRVLGQMTAFDFILLIVLGQAIQYGMVGNDYSLTNALVLIATLVGVHLALNHLAHRIEPLSRWMDGTPLVIVQHGRLIDDRAARMGITKQDVLESARLSMGLERMEQIRYAVAERSGKISVIPER